MPYHGGLLALVLATFGGVRASQSSRSAAATYAAMAGPLFEAVYGRKIRETGEVGRLNAPPIAGP